MDSAHGLYLTGQEKVLEKLKCVLLISVLKEWCRAYWPHVSADNGATPTPMWTKLQMRWIHDGDKERDFENLLSLNYRLDTGLFM